MTTYSLQSTINQTLELTVRCLIWFATQITAYLIHTNGRSPPDDIRRLMVLDDISDGDGNTDDADEDDGGGGGGVGNRYEDGGKQKLSRSGKHQATMANDIHEVIKFERLNRKVSMKCIHRRNRRDRLIGQQ